MHHDEEDVDEIVEPASVKRMNKIFKNVVLRLIDYFYPRD